VTGTPPGAATTPAGPAFVPPGSTLRVLEPAPGVLAFYDGRVPGTRLHSVAENWLDDGAYALGIASYAVLDGAEALVYDPHISIPHARLIRAALEARGARRLTLVLSHWHDDHVAGNAVFADGEIIASTETAALLEAHRDRLGGGGPPHPAAAAARLRLRRRARRDDGAAAFVADCQCFTDPPAHRAHPRGRNIGGDHRQAVAGRGACGRHVGAAEQQAQVRRIDRGGKNFDQYLMRLGRWHRTPLERHLQLALGLNQGQHGQVGIRQVGHCGSPVAFRFLDATD